VNVLFAILSYILKERNEFRLSELRVLRKMFGPKEEEVTGNSMKDCFLGICVL
jgi:hypothetical protein